VARAFFTYVWGPPGEPAWPLSFANKGARTRAKKLLEEGDWVFTVCTAGDPSPPEHWGRVVGVYRVSDLEVNIADYGLPKRDRHPEIDSRIRFPYALHPIAAWEVTTSQNRFAELVGSLTPTHHLQAQSSVVQLDESVAKPLIKLARREVKLAMPQTEFGYGRVARKNSRLAPKHEGSFVGSFREYEVWYVYTLVLRDARRKAFAIKVGYGHEPNDRAASYNLSLASEVTGFRWVPDLVQPTSSEEAARQIEQAILDRFAKHRLDSNGEILAITDPTLVATAIAEEMRRRAASISAK